MDDVWVCVDEEITSSVSSADSDNVDSEIEAELYGMIHHEDNLSQATDYQNNEDTVNNQTSELPNPVNSITNIIKLCRANTQAKNSFNPSDSSFYQSNFNENSKSANTSLKRKSDSEQISLSVVCSDESGVKKNNPISKQTSSNSKVIKKPYNNFLKKSNLLNKSEKIISDSSDSDESVIWTEPDNSSVMKTELKTNLFNDVDTVSISDSSNDSFVLPSLSSRKEKNQKNLSLPNIKLGERPTDLWHINEEDLYRSKNKSRRYHNSDFRCNNCDQKGHLAKSCPVPKVIKCFICGGPHLGFECKNKICSKCYSWGHHYKHCRINSFGYCCHCSMKGHSKKDCPDIWRRYHLTTKSMRVVRGKKVVQDRTVFCFNCGWSGHHGAVCKNFRNPKGPFHTWPSVISYDNPDKFIASQRNARSSFIADMQENHMQQSFERVNMERMEQLYKSVKPEGMEQSESVKTERVEQPYVKRRAKTRKSGMQKKWELFRQKKKLLREKDFPRTPIINAEINQFQDSVPDCISIAMKNQIVRRKKNRSRRIKRRQKNAKCPSPESAENKDSFRVIGQVILKKDKQFKQELQPFTR